MDTLRLEFNRRRFLQVFSAAGLSLVPGALAAVAGDASDITDEMLQTAARIAGISFDAGDRERILRRLNSDRGPLPGFEVLREARLGDLPPAMVFNPLVPGARLPEERKPLVRGDYEVARPTDDRSLAFLPVTHLSRLIETRQIRPSELTELYLARLRQYGPVLSCVVERTDEIARRQARQADEEIAAGRYRGPLHGIPYGLKDLFAVRGTRTTWGMSPYRDRVLDEDATVFERLTEAGAILVAKLSTGALATTARWFGGLTLSPWNLHRDAAGSSAGSGSAMAAGLCGFTIGTDTGGSIVGPSTRNGVTGIRPSFGRVSRHGGMVLAWSQDTVGPICRSAEDCALVLDAIQGPDGRDNTLLPLPLNFDATAGVRGLRVGVLRSAFEGEIVENPQDPEAAGVERATRENNRRALEVLASLGVEVVPFDLPEVPVEAIDLIRYVETAAYFEDATRRGDLTEVEEGPEQSVRPIEIRAAWFTPAVHYLQANRLRMRAMQQVAEAMSELDLFVGSHLPLTNRLGLPVVALPSGFAGDWPTSLHLTGRVFADAEALQLAHAYQAVTDFHRIHPPGF